MSKIAIQTKGLCKSYRTGEEDLHVLRGVSFSVKQGEFVAIIGASGSGKSCTQAQQRISMPVADKIHGEQIVTGNRDHSDNSIQDRER